jgi:D-psicose/D-tagatose/L-ribulose 3-epimerase
MSMFKYGVHRMTWGRLFDPDNLEAFFNQVAQTGADFVEMRPPDSCILYEEAKIRDVRKMAEDKGLGLVFGFGYPLGLDMRSEDAFARRYAVKHLTAAIKGIAALGGSEIGGVLYANSPTLYTTAIITRQMKHDQVQRCVDSIREVMPVAEDLGIRVNMEVLNRFENYIMNTAAEGMEFCKAVGSKNIGVLLDTFHMSIEEDDIAAAIRSAKDYIGKLHCTEPSRGIPHHNKRINWPEIGQTLKDIGFNKPIIIEAVLAFDNDITSHNMRMWRDLIPDTTMEGRITAMKSGIAYLKKQFNDE